jgi:hypothetical protein
VAQVQQRPPWLSAVFVGPQTRASIAHHRALLGGVVPLELYPDTCHACALPVQAWHPAFALTQGASRSIRARAPWPPPLPIRRRARAASSPIPKA